MSVMLEWNGACRVVTCRVGVIVRMRQFTSGNEILIR